MPAGTGELRVRALMADPRFPPLPAGPEACRVRVHVRGRDRETDGGVLDPVEDYLIQAWPASAAPPAHLKQRDGYGRQLRQSSRVAYSEPEPDADELRYRAAVERLRGRSGQRP